MANSSVCKFWAENNDSLEQLTTGGEDGQVWTTQGNTPQWAYAPFPLTTYDYQGGEPFAETASGVAISPVFWDISPIVGANYNQWVLIGGTVTHAGGPTPVGVSLYDNPTGNPNPSVSNSFLLYQREVNVGGTIYFGQALTRANNSTLTIRLSGAMGNTVDYNILLFAYIKP